MIRHSLQGEWDEAVRYPITGPKVHGKVADKATVDRLVRIFFMECLPYLPMLSRSDTEAAVVEPLWRRLRPFRVKVRSAGSHVWHRIRRVVRAPISPHNADGKVLIHLGCGRMDDPRYINVDGVPFPHVHYVSRLETLPMFADDIADLVYACHVLEHFSYRRSPRVLEEWRRVLKPGGVLRLSVPDFDKMTAMYAAENRNVPLTLPPLMGTQEGQFGFHMTIFNDAYLTDLLKAAGFSAVRPWDPKNAAYYRFNDWAGRYVYGKYPVSLNLEGVK